MDVRGVMTANPATCKRNTSLKEIARLMVENDCGQIPVLDDDEHRPIGVVTDRDIVTRGMTNGENPLKLKASDVMSEPAVTVRPDMDLQSCCHVMEENQIRRAIVEDEEGRCCGIVSMADIARTAPEDVTAEVIRTVSQPGGSTRTGMI